MEVWWIKRYDEVFEDACSRKLVVPNYLRLVVQQDSEAFRWLMRQGRDGHAAFGDFIAIVQIVATLGKAARRSGVLYSSNRALGPTEIASRLGSIKSVLERSFVLLSDSQCGWLVWAEWNPASTPQNAVSEQSISHHPPNGPPPVSQSSPTDPPVVRHARAGRTERVGQDGTERAAEPVSSLRVDPPSPAARQDSVTAFLRGKGIDGSALRLIAQCPEVTVSSLIVDWGEITRDDKVRAPKRVLVNRLCERHGITLPKSGGKGIGMEALRELEGLRERHRNAQVAKASEARSEAERHRDMAAQLKGGAA